MPHNRRDGARVLSSGHADPGLPGGRRLRRSTAPLVQPRQQRVALPAAAGGARGDRARARHAQPLPRPDQLDAARSASRDRYGVPAARIAIGNGSCDILLAAGEALLEPGAELVYAWPSFSVYPHLAAASGARAITRRARRRGAPRPRRDAARDHRRDAPGDRLQPQQPDQHRAAARARSPSSSREVPPHVCVLIDEAYCEFNLLDDPDASLELLERHPNLVLLRTFSKVYGLCGLRVGFALCGSRRAAATRSTRCASRSSATRSPRPPRSRRSRHQDEVDRARRRARSPSACRWTSGCARSASTPADSQANFCWFELGEERDEARGRCAGLRRARRARARRRARSASEGALRVTYGTPEENERFLEALAEVL